LIQRQAERRKDKLETKDKMAQSNPRCGTPMKRINKLMKENLVRFMLGIIPLCATDGMGDYSLPH